MDRHERLELEAKALEIRALTIEEIGVLGVGHLGGALSIVEVLTLLYYKRMKVDPAKALDPDRDRLVLSKGHAGPALYAVLADKGYFPKEWLLTLNKGGTRLPSHCDRNKTPGIDMTTGSLGQGLSAASGMALALRMEKRPSLVYCIIGDGESDEGQNYEAALFATHYGLGNLVAFMDYNKMQIDGATKDVLDLEDPVARWKAFGWESERVDGHDFAALDAAIGRAVDRTLGDVAWGGSAGKSATRPSPKPKPKPTMIVMDTIKAKGCSFCEGQATSHNCTVSPEQLAQALEALGRKRVLGLENAGMAR